MHQALSDWQPGGFGTGTAVLQRDRAQPVGWCDGTLVTHVDDWVECTEPDCEDLQETRHMWVLACASLWAACPCRPDGHTRPA